MLGIGLVIFLTALAFSSAIVPIPIPRGEDLPRIVQAFQNDEPAVSYRLPNNTRPNAYDVHLTTHVHTQTNLSFSGVVAVRFSVLETSRTITLHHRQLTIGQSTLALASSLNQLIELGPIEYNSENEFLSITLADTDLIVNNEYVLTIAFNGTLRSDKGFFWSSYQNELGAERLLASTHLEQTDARHVFPCFDEPELRAYFTFRMTHGSGYHALSNMPVVSVTPGENGYSTTAFANTTSPMPTYLVAFLVSEFASKSLVDSNGFEHRIFAQPNAMNKTELGLSVARQTMDDFTEYLGVGFTLPKMDQAAVPRFRPGAMENWGLILYREEYLLYDPQIDTFVRKYNVVTTVIHEWAHQWFGNLVTLKWWTYIWLNEGFASMFENYGIDWLYPEWKIMDAFVFKFLQNTMVTDSRLATRPITHYGESPDEVSKLFDTVAYAKSGCVLNMLLHAFTEESFKKGLFTYLNRMQNSAAVEDDLFEELEKSVKDDGTLATGYDVPTIFASWTHQAGYPLVSVERDYTNGQISLSQERYLSFENESTTQAQWWIPYNYATASNVDFNATAATAWLSARTEIIAIPSALPTDWLLINKRQTGYYRVKYDLRNYQLLSEQLRSDPDRIHLTSRSQLIDDAFDLARTERLGYDVVFELIKYLEHEVEYVPWASTFRGLELVDRLYAGQASYPLLKDFIVKQLSHLLSEASLVAAIDEHHFRKEARNQAIQWSCRLGSADCLSETNNVLQSFVISNVSVHQDHRTSILCAGIRTATDVQFNQFLDTLELVNDEEERAYLVAAVGCTVNRDMSQQLLQMTINEQSRHLRTPAERFSVYSAIAANGPDGTTLAFEFLEANLDAVFGLYEHDNINSAVTLLATFVVSDEHQFNDLVAVAQDKTYIDAATITTARQTLATNERWIARNHLVIEEWLIKNNAGAHVASVLLMAVLLFVTQFCNINI